MSALPVPDRDSAPWWTALADHRLMLQACGSCSTLRWAPRALCNICGSFEWSWQQSNGVGSVVAWTVSHRSYEAGRQVPYVVVLVSMSEAPNIVVPGNWSGDPTGRDLSVGMGVAASYTDLPTDNSNDPRSILCWTNTPSPT